MERKPRLRLAARLALRFLDEPLWTEDLSNTTASGISSLIKSQPPPKIVLRQTTSKNGAVQSSTSSSKPASPTKTALLVSAAILLAGGLTTTFFLTRNLASNKPEGEKESVTSNAMGNVSTPSREAAVTDQPQATPATSGDAVEQRLTADSTKAANAEFASQCTALDKAGGTYLAPNNTDINDQGLSHLESIHSTKFGRLNLRSCYNISNFGLQYVSKMICLVDLDLSETPITDDGMIWIGKLPSCNTC